MGHGIIALLTAHPCDAERAAAWDLHPVAVWPLTLFHLDHYYSAYWQALRGHTGQLAVGRVPGIFPTEDVVRAIACDLTGEAEPTFAVIMTEYFGGAGDQWACAFMGARRISAEGATINAALALLGVVARPGLDAFDTIGLGHHRSPPEYLEKYVALCDERGV